MAGVGGHFRGAPMALLALIAAACADQPTELPSAPAVLDAPSAPVAGVVGYRLATACSPALARLRAATSPLVVDLEFLWPTSEALDTGPTEEARAIVQHTGGQILHEFAAPALRVRIDPAGLETLLTEEPRIAARIVPDVDRHDLVLALDTGGEPLAATEQEAIEALGARIVDPRPLPEVLIAAHDAAVVRLVARFGPRLTLEPSSCTSGS